MNHQLPWVGFRLFVQSPRAWLCTKARNPTHGSGWMVQVPSTDIPLNRFVIPPMAVGEYFKTLPAPLPGSPDTHHHSPQTGNDSAGNMKLSSLHAVWGPAILPALSNNPS